MEKHAKVVVIGGGVVGCSILFHHGTDKSLKKVNKEIKYW